MNSISTIPPLGTAGASSVQRDRGTQTDRVDLVAQSRRQTESRALQLLQCVQLQAAYSWLFLHRQEAHTAEHRANQRVCLESDYSWPGGSDVLERGCSSRGGGRIPAGATDAGAFANGERTWRRRKSGRNGMQDEPDHSVERCRQSFRRNLVGAWSGRRRAYREKSTAKRRIRYSGS